MMKKNTFIKTLAVCTVVLCSVPVAFGDLLTANDLFLDPWDVPLDLYERIYLDTTWDGSNVGNNSYTWSYNDVQAVQVLPLLNPYSQDDPAGYPIGYNFTQDNYLYQPNDHYWVDLTNGQATATFERPGIFHVRLDRINNPDEIDAVFVDSGVLDDLGEKSKTGASVEISGPKADLVIVSDPTGGDSTLDDAAANAEDDNGSDKVKRAASVSAAIARIKEAYEANNNKKLHVELVAHGSKAHLTIGDSGVGSRAGDSMTIEDFQKEIDQYVSKLSIYACEFAKDAEGRAALQTLADSIGVASGFTSTVSVHRSEWFGWLVGGSWDLPLRGQEVTIPAPGAVVLGLIGLTMAGWIKRRVAVL